MVRPTYSTEYASLIRRCRMRKTFEYQMMLIQPKQQNIIDFKS